MGAYINPMGESKESFLNREGIQLNKPPAWADCPYGYLPVVLMDNGPFTAAGIAYAERELRAFTLPDDFRPKKFYFVEIAKLYPVSNLEDYESYFAIKH